REVDGAVARRLGPDERPAPAHALSGQHASELVPQPFVLPEEEPDFAPADSDVAGRHVGVRSDVPEQFAHEALAEAHHLVVTLAFGIEIGAALPPTHGQRRQRVLEHLLEGEKLEDAEVDRWMETEPALVRADCAVHLDAEAAVDLHL